MTGAEHGLAPTSTEPTPINAAPVTPPVEATLRILLNSVPFLMGVAVAPAIPQYPPVEVEQSSVFTPPPETSRTPEPAGEPQLTLVSETATEVSAPEPAPRAEPMSRRDSVDLVVEEVRKSLEDAGDA